MHLATKILPTASRRWGDVQRVNWRCLIVHLAWLAGGVVWISSSISRRLVKNSRSEPLSSAYIKLMTKCLTVSKSENHLPRCKFHICRWRIYWQRLHLVCTPSTKSASSKTLINLHQKWFRLWSVTTAQKPSLLLETPETCLEATQLLIRTTWSDMPKISRRWTLFCDHSNRRRRIWVLL